MVSADNIPVQLEELRGRITGVKRDQQNHEVICAERYEGIRSDINSLKTQIGWAAGIIVTVVIAILGWSLKSQWDNEQETVQALIRISEQQRSAQVAPAPPPVRTPVR